MIIRNFRINSVSMKPLFVNRTIFTTTRLHDESSSSSDDDNDKAKLKENKNVAVEKLNQLILLMSKKEPPTKLASQVKIAKPRETTRQKGLNLKKQKELNAQKIEDKLGDEIAEAATKVAESLGGDVKKTEKELLDVYFSRRLENQTSEGNNDSLNDVLLGMKLEKNEEVPEDVAKPRGEFSRMKGGGYVTKKHTWMRKERQSSSSDDFSGVGFESDGVSSDGSRAHQVRSVTANDKPDQFYSKDNRRSVDCTQLKLFGEESFKYFDVDKIKSENVTPVSLPTWEFLYQRSLKIAITHPPKNIFEQLIQWTDEGKLWRFPIDNEQDWIEEQQYDFSDHVFLERWLEPWCPESGAIRYFMELVCVGLSKNPYLTVPEKLAHIFWYEHYFRSKNSLLMETGIGEIKSRTVSESASA